MINLSKKDFVGKSVFFLIIFLISGVFGCDFISDVPHKSDAEMIENFHKNKVDFENLLQMIQEDEKKIGSGVFRIDVDWTQPQDLAKVGITEDKS